MRNGFLMAALAGVALVTANGEASAQAARFNPALKESSPLLTHVRFGGGPGFRLHGGGFGRHGFGHPGGFGGFRHRGGFGFHRGFGHRFGYRHGFYGGGYGAGLAGLAAGAVIGSTLAPGYGYGYGYGAPGYVYAPAPAVGVGNAVAYCEQRFRSYNPATGTYLGYDGLRHPCP